MNGRLLGLNDFLASHRTRAIQDDGQVDGWTVGFLADRLFRVQADFKNRAFRFSGRQNRTVELDLQFDLGKNGGLFLFGESGLSTRKGEQHGEEEEGMFFHDVSFEWLLISEKP